MLDRILITVSAIVAVTLLAAAAAMLLLSPAPGLREYASMIIWCSVAAGVIGGCMVAGSVVSRRSDDVHLQLTVYPTSPDLETLDRQDGERGALWGLLVFVSAVITGGIGFGLSSFP
jgi:hypothetical protein